MGTFITSNILSEGGITGTTISATTISATSISGDTFYGNGSGLINLTDSYVTGATLNSTTLELGRNEGLSDVNVDLGSILGPLKVISLTSTDVLSTFGLTTPLVCPWDVETYKDNGFTHSNSTNNTRITVDDDGTYQIAASIRVFETSEQRAQFVCRILINGVIQPQPYGSGYIRNNGNSSDYWSAVVNPPPTKLSAGDYVEVQIQMESQTTPTFTSTFQGDESSFSVINLNGVKGDTGSPGTLTGNTGVFSDTFSGLTTEATFYGDGSNLTSTPSIYTQNNTIGTNRVAIITDSLTWSGGSESRIINGRTIKEVTQASDIPTALEFNTTYIIRGQITTSTNHTCNVEGVEILGLNRDVDEIVWAGTGAFLTLTDCNFNLQGIKVSSALSGNSILSATNISASGYNNSRLKVLTFNDCQFRGVYDVWDINGYDLVDINNCLFFYVKAVNFGLRFRDTSKVEITSCELIRWFDEASITPPFSTPTNFSTVSMIEFQSNNLASFGAVNINGCIIHPQQTQNGIDISTGSTTGFATIAANAFINAGLTTGEVFLPIVSAALPNYSDTSTTTYDIYSNQGLLDSKAGSIHTLVGNTTDTSLSLNTPVIVNSGGGTVQQAGVRFDVTSAGRATYVGTKQLYLSIHITLTFLKQGKGTDDYVFYIALNGSVIPASETPLRDLDDIEGGLGLVYGTLMNTNDYIELWVENTSSNDDMLVTGYKILIRE
jgi:hypothetical protein